MVVRGHGEGRGVRVGPAARLTSIFLSRRKWRRERGVHVVPTIGWWRGVGRSRGRQRGQEAQLAATVPAPQLPHLLPATAHQILVLRYPHLLTVDYASALRSRPVPEIFILNINPSMCRQKFKVPLRKIVITRLQQSINV